jgi:hypothetical protein
MLFGDELRAEPVGQLDPQSPVVQNLGRSTEVVSPIAGKAWAVGFS